jgi:hypothetical protein
MSHTDLENWNSEKDKRKITSLACLHAVLPSASATPNFSVELKLRKLCHSM